MKKIIFTGPESTGKSTLASAVAAHYETIWVEEYARTYLETLGRPYREEDLLEIAKGQVQLEEEIAKTTKGLFLFCDTSLLVIKIWSEFKYGRCHPWIEERLKRVPATLYFLCGIDVEWKFDPLREHPEQRVELFELYRKELELLKIPYIIITGNQTNRQNKVIDILSMY